MAKKEGYVFLPLLTVAEAAKYLGVGRRIVYQLIERGEITVVQVEGPFELRRKVWMITRIPKTWPSAGCSYKRTSTAI
jgi:excisionase family DNA binding protein